MACSANSAAKTPANRGRCQAPSGWMMPDSATASPVTNGSTSSNSSRYETLRSACLLVLLETFQDSTWLQALPFKLCELAAFCSLTLVAAVKAESRSRRAWSYVNDSKQKTTSPFPVCTFGSPHLAEAQIRTLASGMLSSQRGGHGRRGSEHYKTWLHFSRAFVGGSMLLTAGPRGAYAS